MTHKSKISLIVLCLLGMAFSYSCTCRSSSYDPKYWSASKVYSTGTYKSVESYMGGFYLYVKITEGSGDEGMTIEYKIVGDGDGLTPDFDGTEASKLEVKLQDGIYTGYFNKESGKQTINGKIYWGENLYIILGGTRTELDGKEIILEAIE